MVTNSNILKRLRDSSRWKLEILLRNSFQKEYENLFSKKSKVNILSVSTGDGSWDYQLLRDNKNINKIVATDIIDFGFTEEDSKILKKEGNWEFIKVNPEKPILLKEKFDFIYHFDVVEHVNYPYKFLKNQYDLLSDGGYILIYTPNLFRPLNVFRLLLGKLIFPRMLGEGNSYGDCYHIQEFSTWQLANLLLEIGFKNIKINHILFGLANFSIVDYPKNVFTKSLCHGFYILAEKK